MNNLGALTSITDVFIGRRDDDEPLRFIDMFCGIGGFHLALAALNMECVYACDIDNEARRAYEHNFEITPAEDITLIEPENIPDYDIFCGGFPCQPFSIIGDRAGFDDTRGTLFFDIARILNATKPTAFILENVRQLETHDGGKTLARILAELRRIGYALDYKIFDARNFGLPHKRERIIIVGLLGGMDNFTWPDKKLPMRPLSDILETDEEELKEHYVSQEIKKSRQAKHTAKMSPAIWHENKGGCVASHPFSCALRAGASHNYLLVDGERRLTPREMLRLQGFPDYFEIICNKGQTRKQAGNAVAVPVVKAVAYEVKNAISKNKRRKKRA